jgi:hypothetical protein
MANTNQIQPKKQKEQYKPGKSLSTPQALVAKERTAPSPNIHNESLKSLSKNITLYLSSCKT